MPAAARAARAVPEAPGARARGSEEAKAAPLLADRLAAQAAVAVQVVPEGSWAVPAVVRVGTSRTGEGTPRKPSGCCKGSKVSPLQTPHSSQRVP